MKSGWERERKRERERERKETEAGKKGDKRPAHHGVKHQTLLRKGGPVIMTSTAQRG